VTKSSLVVRKKKVDRLEQELLRVVRTKAEGGQSRDEMATLGVEDRSMDIQRARITGTRPDKTVEGTQIEAGENRPVRRQCKRRRKG